MSSSAPAAAASLQSTTTLQPAPNVFLHHRPLLLLFQLSINCDQLQWATRIPESGRRRCEWLSASWWFFGVSRDVHHPSCSQVLDQLFGRVHRPSSAKLNSILRPSRFCLHSSCFTPRFTPNNILKFSGKHRNCVAKSKPTLRKLIPLIKRRDPDTMPRKSHCAYLTRACIGPS